MPEHQPGPNPFVGPRAYQIGETLYGREDEKLGLLDLLIAERIVLLYSPSGAGKTSLVQAALVPALKNEAFTVPAVARVTFKAAGISTDLVANRYIFGTLLSLEEALPNERQLPIEELASMTLPAYLEQRWAAAPEEGGFVLILDQFEEILTVDSTDSKVKEQFFSQLGAALHSRSCWALFAMREEYVAGLDPYRRLIPTRLSSTFRLEPLNDEQARKAMQETTSRAGVVFTNPAARRLADDLRRVRVQQLGGQLAEQLGPSIEPTQLQVVCLRLWSKLPSGKAEIEERDVEELGSVDTALADYYTEVVTQAAQKAGTRERLVREWVEDELITPQGLRNQVLQDNAGPSGGLDVRAIEVLEHKHLVRAERRRGITWLELAHDRLIAPVQRSNAAWREAHFTPFQRQAALWDSQGRPSHLELRGASLSEAERWAAAHRNELTQVEVSFLKTCKQSRRHRRIRLFAVPAVLVSAAALTYSVNWYQGWFDAQPWGHLVNLFSGETHELRGDVVSIGRMTEGPLRSQVAVEESHVSGLHLLVSRDLHAHDLRSLNGTTINAWFLQYRMTAEISHGDLISLAGTVLFRFSTAERSYLPFLRPSAPESSPPPERTWAILVDGASKGAIPLVNRRYFLSIGEKKEIKLSEDQGENSLLEIGGPESASDGDLTLVNRARSYDLLAVIKYEDRRYVGLKILRDKSFRNSFQYYMELWLGNYFQALRSGPLSGTEYLSKISFCYISPQNYPYNISLKPFIIDPLDLSLCIVGPFQVVLR